MPLINQPNFNATVTGSQGGVAWETAFDIFGRYYQDGGSDLNAAFDRGDIPTADYARPEFNLANNSDLEAHFDILSTNQLVAYGTNPIMNPKNSLWTHTGFQAICLCKFSLQVPADSPDGMFVSGFWSNDDITPPEMGGQIVLPGGYYELTEPNVITPSSSAFKNLTPTIIPASTGAFANIRFTIAKYNLN